jgi:hypothetical protein
MSMCLSAGLIAAPSVIKGRTNTVIECHPSGITELSNMLNPGELGLILGMSGSGKTTIMYDMFYHNNAAQYFYDLESKNYPKMYVEELLNKTRLGNVCYIDPLNLLEISEVNIILTPYLKRMYILNKLSDFAKKHQTKIWISDQSTRNVNYNSITPPAINEPVLAPAAWKTYDIALIPSLIVHLTNKNNKISGTILKTRNNHDDDYKTLEYCY